MSIVVRLHPANLTIWDSGEQLQAYGEVLMPILADAGLQLSCEPEVFEVHNIVKR